MIFNKYQLPKLIQEIDNLKIYIIMVETEYVFKTYSVRDLDQLTFNQLLGSFILSSFKLFQCINSVQLLSHVWLFVTPWTAARQASWSITNSQSRFKLMSISSVMPSNHLILCHPLLLPLSIFPSIRVFTNESVLCIRWPNYWSFSFSISPSNEYSGLISFRIHWVESPCSPRDSQESSPTPKFKNISSSAFNFFYSPTLTSIHDYWKNHSFD